MKHCLVFTVLLILCYGIKCEELYSFDRFLSVSANSFNVGEYSSIKVFNKNRVTESNNDTSHYWTLKPFLDPFSESVRINPENYEDKGVIDPDNDHNPCSTGYVVLCGILVRPDPTNNNRPYFNSQVNSDIYEALKKNQFLEKKVFLRDL
jgi:hypothetical protein